MVGSIWHRWDLHIHTPASYEHQFRLTESVSENKYQDSIWERYIVALEAQNSVPVVGVTDYFSIEGYKKVIEYKRRGRLSSYDLILPNIEFRLDTIFTREGRKAESINFHVIFSDQLNPEVIEREFLECLDIKTPQNEPRRLSRANIEEIGCQLKEQQGSFSNRSDYEIGCTNIKVSFDQIQEVLTQKKGLVFWKIYDCTCFRGTSANRLGRSSASRMEASDLEERCSL